MRFSRRDFLQHSAAVAAGFGGLQTLSAHQSDKDALRTGVNVITIPDIRWQRCDIKSVALLPNVLGKQQARDANAFEAWQVDDEGYVTEGTSTNAWIVTADGDLVTRNASTSILNGVTRLSVLEAAAGAEAGVEAAPALSKNAQKRLLKASSKESRKLARKAEKKIRKAHRSQMAEEPKIFNKLYAFLASPY